MIDQQSIQTDYRQFNPNQSWLEAYLLEADQSTGL